MTNIVSYRQLETGWWLIELEEKKWWRKLPSKQLYLVESLNICGCVYVFPDLEKVWSDKADLIKQLIALETKCPNIAKVLNKYAEASKKEGG